MCALNRMYSFLSRGSLPSRMPTVLGASTRLSTRCRGFAVRVTPASGVTVRVAAPRSRAASMPRAASAVASLISSSAASSGDDSAPSSDSDGRLTRASTRVHCESGRSETTIRPFAPPRMAACALCHSATRPAGAPGLATAAITSHAPRTSCPAKRFESGAGPAITRTGPDRSVAGRPRNGSTATSRPMRRSRARGPPTWSTLVAVSTAWFTMAYRWRNVPPSPPGRRPNRRNSAAMYAAVCSSSGLGVSRPRIESSASEKHGAARRRP